MNQEPEKKPEAEKTAPARSLFSAIAAVLAAAAALIMFFAPDAHADCPHDSSSDEHQDKNIDPVHQFTPHNMRTALAMRVTIHAAANCHTARAAAHLVPSSRLTDAIAATHGV